MSRLSYKDETSVREAVKTYIELHGMTSLRIVAKAVKDKTGILPSANTIARLARELGYDKPKTIYTWEKVKS